MTTEQRIIDNPVESEMRDSFLEYSLSVIMARALPDVRDGLKPVHRRILYGMTELGIRPNTPYKKSARVTGDVMGKYHPHGDSALYDALVRLAQPWSLRAPLVDGHGNFGSLDDGPAAARYCVVGDTRVRLADGRNVRIEDLCSVEPNTTADIDLWVIGAHGERVHASKFHHSGTHPTLRMSTREGFELVGTGNHPVVVLAPDGDGVATASWRLLEDVQPGDLVAISRHTVSSAALTVANDDYYFSTVADVVDAGDQPVFSLRVDTDEHAFVTNGFVSHNTECRLDQMGASLLEGLNEGTVDFIDNYDGTETEPTVLPAAFPNLLVNGSQGIAVGMATNMAPHNLVEVVAGLRAMLANPEIALPELMAHIPGPDLPTGGSIWGLDGVEEAYRTGRGTFKMRATAEITDVSTRRKGIVISELPYLVGPERIITKVKELVAAKRLNGISDIRDHSDRKNGLRVVVECKTGFNPAAVLDELYRLTPLEESFGINNVALVGGEPRTLGLLDLCRLYLDHRRDVIRRRTQHRLDKAEARLHIIEGLLIALDAIDEVVATIRGSKTTETARKNLRSKFKLSEIQAQHILDMPLRRLTSLEVTKLRDEQKEVKAMIADLRRILADTSALDGLVGDELQLVADTYGDARRTRLMSETPVASAVAAALEVPDEPCWVTLTTTGLIGRGAAVASKAKPTKADVLVDALATTTRSTVAVLTDQGRVLRINTVELPAVEGKNKGGRVDEFVVLETGETAIAVVPYNPDDAADRTLVLVTAGGVIKRAGLDTLVARNDGITIIALDDGDRLVAAFEAGDGDDAVIVTSAARLLRTPVGKIRAQGRTARGVAGMRLDDDGVVIAAGRVTDTATVAVVTDTGAVKLTPAVEYPAKGRGGGGVRCCTFRKADTELVAATIVDAEALVPTAAGIPVAAGDWVGKRDGSGVATDPAVDGFGRRRP